MATAHAEKLKADKSHLEGNAKPGGGKGCVTKCVGSDVKAHHGSFRKNGYDATKGNPAKKTYYKPDLTRLKRNTRMALERSIGERRGTKHRPANPLANLGAWGFTGKNFLNGNKPYAHNYHHMVPWEALKKSLEHHEMLALQQAGYNLNDGMNMIILPCFPEVARILRMYTHPNNHPTYNLELENLITEVKLAVTGDEEKHLKPEELRIMKEALEIWEEQEWFVLQRAGRMADAAHVDTHEPSSILYALIGAG